MSATIMQRMLQLSCCDISDALDRLGISGQCLGIRPLNPRFSLVGQAVTLRYALSGESGGTVGDYIDDLGPQQVVAIDNAGRMDATVWGDLLTLAASKRSVAGTVIDGVCRDVDRSIELNYPIFARGNYMRTGKQRVHLAEVGGAICVGGVLVEHGDWLRGDGDGVVSIPVARIEEVLTLAEVIRSAEARIRDAVEAGGSLKAARAEVGYHTLQTQRSEPSLDARPSGQE
jgi:4-hydroxy-4-methyl-2-oxoglutarate aldolase